MKRIHDTCASCEATIYLNLDPERQVDRWCHLETGSVWCGLAETTTAAPRQHGLGT